MLWPKAGFAKGEMIDYYARVADVLLPHLKGRPLTLKRYPNGVEEKFFYEKRCPKHRPDWVNTAPIWSGRNEGEIDYCVCDDRATLIWVAQLASLELHPSSRARRRSNGPRSSRSISTRDRRPRSSSAARSGYGSESSSATWGWRAFRRRRDRRASRSTSR